MTEKSKIRAKARKLWNRLKLFMIILLVVVSAAQAVYVDHLKTEKANLQYQLIVEKQDAQTAMKELKELQSEMIQMQQNTIKASRGASRTAVVLTEEEFELVCRVVIQESRGQSTKGQAIVAQCIYCRLVSNCYGANVTEVVMAPGQFAAPFMGDMSEYPSAVYAVYSVFYEGTMPLDADVRVFFNPATADPGAIAPLRSKYTYIITEGNHEVRGYV